LVLRIKSFPSSAPIGDADSDRMVGGSRRLNLDGGAQQRRHVVKDLFEPEGTPAYQSLGL